MTGSTWHASPSADRRNTQIRLGGVASLSVIVESRVAIEGGAILTDGSESGNAALAYLSAHRALEPRAATDADSSVAKGRGGAFFLDVANHRWVARPYRRGGLAALVSRDGYLWTSEGRVRSFREWRTLAVLHARALPVPRPIAARYRRDGLVYRAELITQRLEHTEPLSPRLEREILSLAVWVAIGRCLRRFHDAGAYHADLNAHNILLDTCDAATEKVWLIDFDRGGLRRPGTWRDANLARLYRSLRKISMELAPDRFGPTEWETLLVAYRSLSAASNNAVHGAA
jgi:3-deoxy-D-manno-octulosonic acid kinase